METLLYSVAIVLIFGAVIFFHEAGHFLIAKLGRIRVDEFALGLGPVLASFKKGETQYSLRAVPVGGMVRVAGMEGEEKVRDGFNSRPLGVRVGVIAAGPVMNVVLAAIIFCLIYTVFGKPIAVTPVIAKVGRGMPAAVAGMRPGDKLISVNGVTSKDLGKLREQIVRNPGRSIAAVVERDGRQLRLHVVPERKRVVEQEAEYSGGKLVRVRTVKRWIGQVGIIFKEKRQHLSLRESVKTGMEDTWDYLRAVGESLLLVFRGKAEVEVSGPVGIVSMMYERATVSWLSFLHFAGIFNIMVAFFNLLPFPALDGSRIAFLGVEAIRGRPIDPRKEAIVHTVGMVLLLLLVLLVTVSDIWKKWGPQ